jgi:imidazolonepropionase-like amidohydrolase
MSLAVATAASAQTIAITGGRVFPVSSAPIDNGTVIIRDGRIVQVGANLPVPAGAQRIDATGKWVTPGLVVAETQLGLFDAGFGAGPTDVAARGRNDALTPSFRVWEGINPRSVYVAPARQAGVTSVVVAPRTDAVVGGQAAMIDLVDGALSDMVFRPGVAMVANFDFPPGDKITARGELFARLRELLDDARAYARRKPDFERNQARQFLAGRLDLDAMIPVLEGRQPLVVRANRASDIEMALEIAREYSLKLVITGGAEAWQVAPKLAAAKVPVLVGAMNNIPGSFNVLGMRQENAAQLRAAGVTVALVGNAGGGDEDAFNVRNIRYEAGNAVAYGMAWNDALRAVTLAPAEMFGAADRVGSLQPGRVANVVIWSGDPFELLTNAERVFVRGQESTTPSRQDLLEQRYRRLPPDYRRP